jgi:hypothetical protein
MYKYTSSLMFFVTNRTTSKYYRKYVRKGRMTRCMYNYGDISMLPPTSMLKAKLIFFYETTIMTGQLLQLMPVRRRDLTLRESGAAPLVARCRSLR